MSVKLRLKRMGRRNRPFYRLNAIESRNARDGLVIEDLGHFDPLERDAARQFTAKLDRCKHWLDHGAIPSQTVSSLLKRSGLDHKQLRLPKPGKPKPAAVEPAKKDAAAAPEPPREEAAKEPKKEEPKKEEPKQQEPKAEATT
jgi:small subunit ribosomal protein S16